MNKNYTCENCGSNLKEVGVYTKTTDSYDFNEHTNSFVLNSKKQDLEGIMCGDCGAYVDVNILK